MSHPLSPTLNSVFSSMAAHPQENVSVDLLRIKVADQLGASKDCALALMNGAIQEMRHGTILLYLVNIAQFDSAVRDVITSGHLAKLLSRLAYLKEPDCYKILAWPNVLFDRLSQMEREEYFKRGKGLPTDGKLLENPAIARLRSAENEILLKFGINNH